MCARKFVGSCLVLLKCDDIVEYSKPVPEPRSFVYCRRCQDWREVIEEVKQVKVRCRQCPYARLYGQDLQSARSKAYRHSVKFSHTVDITGSDSGNETVSQDETQGELPFQRVIDERAQMVRDHQGSLRAFQASLPNRDLTE